MSGKTLPRKELGLFLFPKALQMPALRIDFIDR